LIANEVQSIWNEEAWQKDAGRSARTLLKYPDLRIVFVSMNTGTYATKLPRFDGLPDPSFLCK
jgi:hypothetical protein